VDPEVLDTLDVVTEIATPSILFDEHLSTLVVCRLVTLSLEHGNSDAACFAYRTDSIEMMRCDPDCNPKAKRDHQRDEDENMDDLPSLPTNLRYALVASAPRRMESGHRISRNQGDSAERAAIPHNA
jgi:hypothetical protein